jgi:hypothetical protein
MSGALLQAGRGGGGGGGALRAARDARAGGTRLSCEQRGGP